MSVSSPNIKIPLSIGYLSSKTTNLTPRNLISELHLVALIIREKRLDIFWKVAGRGACCTVSHTASCKNLARPPTFGRNENYP
ncbi:MAG: hypothetical protein P8O86_05150, partial [Actinomycetota bacterium]|nr:hypothetical protein [Actinomycetota bacterium]